MRGLLRIATACAAILLPLRASVRAAEAPQVNGPYEVTLMLPPAGLFAGEEMEVEFRVVYRDPSDPSKSAVPVLYPPLRAEVDMPCMPSMPRFDELAHREGIPGVWGVHPTFPHGGDYRLCLTVFPPGARLAGDTRPDRAYPFDFSLRVFDASASPRPETAKIRPFRLEMMASPPHPTAGEDVDLEFRVRLANSFEQREVVDFDPLHERLMHVFMVRDDLTGFVHEHPSPAGRGVFRLRHRFPAAGRYRIFVDVAPKDAGAQTPRPVARCDGTPAARPPRRRDLRAFASGRPSARRRRGRAHSIPGSPSETGALSRLAAVPAREQNRDRGVRPRSRSRSVADHSLRRLKRETGDVERDEVLSTRE